MALGLLDEIKPDVVHFQSHIVVGRGLAREAVKRGIRLIGTNHFMPENGLQFTPFIGPLREPAIRAAWNAAARTFGLAEAVTTPTRKAADYIERYTYLKGVYPISCGLHIDHYTIGGPAPESPLKPTSRRRCSGCASGRRTNCRVSRAC